MFRLPHSGPRTRLTAMLVGLALTTPVLALLPAAAAPPTAAAGNSIVLFKDKLGTGVADWSWATTNLASTTPAVSGRAISVDYGPWQGLQLGLPDAPTFAAGSTLTFQVHGGRHRTVRLSVVALDSAFAPVGRNVQITAPGGRWTSVSIPLADLGATSRIGGVWWQETSGKTRSDVSFDNIELTAPGPTPTTTRPTTIAPTTTVGSPPTGSGWAYQETFDGDPGAPSQALLPRTMEYSVTHRSHPSEHFTAPFGPYLADHDKHCAGPDPSVSPLPQRHVHAPQDVRGSAPGETFFICKNHLMSSMGGFAPYSISAFWPRQPFRFDDGGVLEFEVNINDAHDVRSWWEVMIVPRNELRVASGPSDSPISETYPKSRIVLDFRRNVRSIRVGEGAIAPDGWTVNQTQRGPYDFAWWRNLHPGDPALTDARERRTMRIKLDGDEIVWGIETATGSFDEWRVAVPGGLPFDEGLVLFKTHAYNPTKDGNDSTYTFHWDSIRFDGPVLKPYVVREASDVVYLQRNGHRPIGDKQTVTIDVPAGPVNPVLFGQVHQAKRGQVLVSINGGPNIAVSPSEYEEANCYSNDWQSFRLPLNAAQLRQGTNTITWTIGPRPNNCPYGPYTWDGFSVKSLQIQTDR